MDLRGQLLQAGEPIIVGGIPTGDGVGRARIAQELDVQTEQTGTTLRLTAVGFGALSA